MQGSQSNLTGRCIAPPLGKGPLAAFLVAMFAVPLVLWWTGPFDLYCWLLGEDGLYETVGAASALVAGLLFATLFFATGHDASRRNFWPLLFALGSVLLFAEEISWGQRVFGFTTPVWMQAANQADETTFHNMVWFQEAQGNRLNAILGLVAITYLGLLPWLAAYSRIVSQGVDRVGLPLPDRSIACAVLTIPLFSIFVQSVWIAQEAGEVAESTLQVVWLLFAIGACREARQTVWIDRCFAGSVTAGAVAAFVVLINGQTTHQPIVGLSSALGEHALRMGDPNGAAEYFEHALYFRPDDPELLTALAAAEITAGSPERAVSLLNEASAIDPNRIETVRLLAVAHLEMDLPDEAGDYAMQLCELLPDDPQAQYLLGVTLFQADNWAEATDAFEQVLRTNPAHAGARRHIVTIESDPKSSTTPRNGQ